jgi:hypothetical protein
MPFGKYRNKRIGKVPTEYLVWLRDSYSGLTDEVRHAVEQELRVREAEEAPAPEAVPATTKGGEPVAVRTVSPTGQALAGNVRMMFRNLALKYHPDRGGSEMAMRALNELHDQVQELIGRTFGS